mgnify:CR=1 FL=1
MTIYATAGTRVFIGAALAAKATDFVLADFPTTGWVEVGEAEGLGTVGDTSAEITFDGIAASRTRRLKGTRNAGSMEIVCGIDPADAGQIAIIAAEKTPHDYAFRLLMNDAPPPAISTVTITIASPGVVSWAGHALVNGSGVRFTTTGALPTGLSAGTTYYVVNAAAGTFQVSATPGGTAIVTSGTQSGVHTAQSVPNGSQRYFVAKVASASEQFDSANSVMKLNATLWVNSNVVKVNAGV